MSVTEHMFLYLFKQIFLHILELIKSTRMKVGNLYFIIFLLWYNDKLKIGTLRSNLCSP